jgi:hypothetical protein
LYHSHRVGVGASRRFGNGTVTNNTNSTGRQSNSDASLRRPRHHIVYNVGDLCLFIALSFQTLAMGQSLHVDVAKNPVHERSANHGPFAGQDGTPSLVIVLKCLYLNVRTKINPLVTLSFLLSLLGGLCMVYG